MNSEYTDITHAGFWQKHNPLLILDRDEFEFHALDLYGMGMRFAVLAAPPHWYLGCLIYIKGKELFKVIEVLPDRVIMQSIKR
jgi:hypothetical protein